MRLLLVSDLHYALRQYDWILDRASQYDAVVLAGDLLSIAAPVTVEVQIVAIGATLRKLAEATMVIACSGNHDLNTYSAAGEKTADWLSTLDIAGFTADGSSVRIDDDLITVLPWWDGPAARAESEAFLDSVDRAGIRRWSWVYHSPPESLLSWTGSRHYGDATVAEWIGRWNPYAVLCGHIHQAPFAPDGSWVDRIGHTWLFNPGKQTGPTPTCIEIDLTAGRARWQSMTGVEEQDLAAEAN
jgi:Icc-related predicted phosphoesterase